MSQTNKFAEKYNDLVTQLVQGHRIPISYLPATLDPKDIATADVGERMREVIYTEAQIDEKEQEIAGWLIATGNVFLIPHYCTDEQYGQTFVQFQNCENCGTTLKPEELKETEDGRASCPDCGESNLTPAANPEGEELGDQYPIGAIQCDIVNPFEIRLDHRVRNVRDLRRFVRIKRFDLDEAKELTGIEDLSPDSAGDDLGQYYLDVISHITSGFAAGPGFLGDGGSGAPSKQPKITRYTLYELPSKKYPQGLQVHRWGSAAEHVSEAGPLKTVYGAGVKQGQRFLPIIHMGGDLVPGRIWRKTKLDDIAALQVYRNIVEANIRLSVQRMGNPVWLIPKGCGLDVITGEPGQLMPYQPLSLGGTTPIKPERMAAELNNLAPLIGLLNQIDQSIEKLAGSFGVQSGSPPAGVTAASALAYLGEQANKSVSTLTSNWAKGWREFERMALELAREHWDEERIRTIMGKNRKWQVAKFTKADLQGDVNLVIDYAGMFPKSMAAERATIAQLIQLQVVSPSDKETQTQILKKFGELDLLGAADEDIDDAVKEQDKFMEEDDFIPFVRPFVDNSSIHLMQHIAHAKTDEFRELPAERQQIFIEHIKETVADMVARRVALTQAGLDPDVPALAEIPSGAATVGAMAGAQDVAKAQAMQQGGGVPSGAEGADPRLDANGVAQNIPQPGEPGFSPPNPDVLPDIAGPHLIKPEGSPRSIRVP